MIYYMPNINLIGRGCVEELSEQLKKRELSKALIVTDKFLSQSKIAEKIKNILEKISIDYILYDEVTPNPTCNQVNKGLKILKENNADFIISIGGGSSQDCASGISILATNGGDILDYEGIDKSKYKGLMTVAVNTTAGTSAELTTGYVLTDEDTLHKMVILDQNSIADITVNDPDFMLAMPPSLTASTGMDALTHAIETIIAPRGYVLTDTTALKAIEMIFEYLPRAYKNGDDIDTREKMVFATFLSGMAFTNAGLGFVHAMAHQLGGVYNLPHGVCNAMLLNIVERENAKYVPDKFVMIAEYLGYDVKTHSVEECVDFIIKKIEYLQDILNIPRSLKDLGIKDPDLELIAEKAPNDTTASNNPYMFTKEEIIAMYKEIL